MSLLSSRSRMLPGLILASVLVVVILTLPVQQPAYATFGVCADADVVLSYSPGADLLPGNDNPSNGLIYDGNTVSLGHGGSIIVGFNNQIAVDGPGEDLLIAEGGVADGAEILISNNGSTFVSLGTHSVSTELRLDIAGSGLGSVVAVKIIDDNLDADLGVDSPTAGFDLDAVEALNCAPGTPLEGRMTGGGSNWMVGDVRVTKGFEIHCDLREPNNIEINWPGGNNFHLTALTSAFCTEDPAIIQAPPKSAPFDTFIGEGTGKFNNVDGATIRFVFVDAGEPGTSDHADIQVWDKDGNPVLDVASLLKNGNFQTHLD